VLLQLGEVRAVVSSYAVPCKTTAGCFTDGHFDVVHHRHGPVSRVYATVLEPGVLRVGDPVLVEPPG
jgi:MOSC domain-containing protein YiiM